MRRLPPLNALRAFEAAARHLSFNAAAGELGVTPTAISHQIKLLEDTVGRTLFVRNPRPISLTEAGERLFPTVRTALDQLAQVVADITETPDTSTLRVSTTVAFASNVLLPRLADWSQEFPDIELEIHASDHPVDLAAERVDVAVRYAAKPGNSMVWREICNDEFRPTAVPSLALKNNGMRSECIDLFSLPLISYRWKSPHKAEPTWEKWRATAIEGGSDHTCLSKAQHIKLSEESHAIEAALAGQGIVLASTVIAAAHIRKKKLQYVSDTALPGLTYYTVHLPERHDGRVAIFHDWLGSILQAH
ncbi:LysR family transcriptional regulator [Roseovarius sp. CAU 1744]|uniref:LysR family transcriptional regulator n=1 Tax=Roseovarius sp. CAU 1744 TaxID=3140368 RepID=UPI00325AF166